jgi:hypothetical protein
MGSTCPSMHFASRSSNSSSSGLTHRLILHNPLFIPEVLQVLPQHRHFQSPHRSLLTTWCCPRQSNRTACVLLLESALAEPFVFLIGLSPESSLFCSLLSFPFLLFFVFYFVRFFNYCSTVPYDVFSFGSINLHSTAKKRQETFQKKTQRRRATCSRHGAKRAFISGDHSRHDSARNLKSKIIRNRQTFE